MEISKDPSQNRPDGSMPTAGRAPRAQRGEGPGQDC